MRRVLILLGLGLSACATQAEQPSSIVRADGRSADPAQVRLALAQCQGEGAVAVQDHVEAAGPIPWAAAMMTRSSKEQAVVRSCMARRGYLMQ